MNETHQGNLVLNIMSFDVRSTHASLRLGSHLLGSHLGREAPCPILSGKQVAETHLFFFIDDNKITNKNNHNLFNQLPPIGSITVLFPIY